MAKNGHVHEGGKVGRSDATSTKLLPVDSYDLKSMSYLNLAMISLRQISFITFEMLRVAYNRPVGKINFSLVFCPSVIRGPLSNPTNNHTSVKQCFDLNKNNLYPTVWPEPI